MRRNTRRIFIIILILLLTSCSRQTIYKEGFEALHSYGVSYSSFTLGAYVINADFVDEFAYLDGNFYYEDTTDVILPGGADRALVWLSYDEDIYTQAKERYLSAYLMEESSSADQLIFGFQFYFYNIQRRSGGSIGEFPLWITAFGYNDEERTLVSIGIYCGSTEEKDSVLLAGTDFGAFLEHFYGDWYEWE